MTELTPVQIWKKALRSKKYKQGKGVLKALDGKMCCLGVCCEISNVSEWNIKPCIDEESEYPNHYKYMDGSAFLPSEVVRWIGLKDFKGSFEGKEINDQWIDSLTKLNDEAEYSFEKIADFIEDNLEELLTPEAYERELNANTKS